MYTTVTQPCFACRQVRPVALTATLLEYQIYLCRCCYGDHERLAEFVAAFCDAQRRRAGQDGHEEAVGGDDPPRYA